MNKLEVKQAINSLYFLKRIKRLGKFYWKEKEVEKDFDIKNYLCFGKWNHMVNEFDQKLHDNFTKEQVYHFEKNVRDVIIRKKKLTSKKKETDGTRGLYHSGDNSIRVFAENQEEEFYIKERLTHELMHMASRKDENNCGFHHIQREGQTISIGKNLNEGYTEFLNAAYFTYHYKAESYPFEKIIASVIEKIVGQKQKKDAYFNGDIFAIFKSLEQYVPAEEGVNLIHEIDCLDEATSKEDYTNRFNQIKKTIGKIQSIKLKRELENDIINTEEFEKRKFFDIDLYEKYNFIYSDKKNLCIQEYNTGYKVISDFDSICLDKEKVNLKFDSDVKIIR